ncbi:hypothetical protein BCR35DRAFT_303804 [Leucosporidium creatinivorum]|uniref:Uncharacterized protein n=1 Tax=Leucosporidium creatinivorum TaxID=106004 RepID=A0A1Y2FER2_9BASI|nr:hypothetical protein BCR35DRAFT_303804 [Leucosporidium creatinivorum]
MPFGERRSRWIMRRRRKLLLAQVRSPRSCYGSVRRVLSRLFRHSAARASADLSSRLEVAAAQRSRSTPCSHYQHSLFTHVPSFIPLVRG